MEGQKRRWKRWKRTGELIGGGVGGLVLESFTLLLPPHRAGGHKGIQFVQEHNGRGATPGLRGERICMNRLPLEVPYPGIPPRLNMLIHG